MTYRLEKRRRGRRPSTAEIFIQDIDKDKRRDPRVGAHCSTPLAAVKAAERGGEQCARTMT